MQDVLGILDFQVHGQVSSQDVFWILESQVHWVKSSYVVCVLDPGLSGAWIGLVCGMCSRSWTLVPLW